MALISARDLSVTLDGHPILADVSLSLEAGEVLAVLGPSGCGKTTLLRAIAGLIPASAGTLQVPPEQPGQAGVRVVFQDPRLLPWLAVEGNIRRALESAGVPREAWAERTASLLAAVGLAGQGALWPRQLSGGMAQRVALVRALAPRPAAILLDEPFAALDPQRREDLQDQLQALVAQTRCAALIVSHDVTEALVLGDRVLVLGGHPGRVRQTISVEAPRPRGEEFRLSPQTLLLRRQIREMLRQNT